MSRSPRRSISFLGRWMRCAVGVSMLVLSLVVAMAASEWRWQSGAGYRWAELPKFGDGHTGFTRMLGATTGMRFTNWLAETRSIGRRNLLSGSGVAAGDVDGDGWCDLYFCRLDGDNALYRNLGNWKFEDITARAGVAGPNLDSMGAAFADIDGDGDLDLLVNVLGGGTRVFQNDGHGLFKDVTNEAGVASKNGSMSLALGDLDGDGALDLYVANYRPTTIMDQPSTRFRFQMVEGRPQVALVNGQPATLPEYTNRFVLTPSGKVLELGEPDALYFNDGHGHFRLRSFTDGSFTDEHGRPLSEPFRDWSLAVQIHDLNDDGAPDIYVCSDLFTPDQIWINDGHGRFRALSTLALRNTSTFSMGIDFADINRDGHTDFFVSDMLSRDHVKRQIQVAEKSPTRSPVGLIEYRPQFSRNTLQLNRGDGTFAEMAFYAGVEASEWSWGPIFLDVDMDGFEDLLIPNGQWGDFQNADVARRVESIRATQRLTGQQVIELVKLYPRLETENLLFRNRGNCTFEEVGAKWGFNAAGISQGACLADLDNDGDLDVVMNNLNAEAGVYRNETSAPRVAVRLKGLPGNTQGIGAKIKLLGGAVPMQSQEVICGGRYLSGDDPMRVFAAGSTTNEMTIEVIWRNGRHSVVRQVKSNRIYEIDEREAKEINAAKDQGPRTKDQRPKTTDHGPRTMDLTERADSNAPASRFTFQSPLFEDVSALLNHQHVEELFDDFTRQPLLPNKLSQLGPGVSWVDVNGDGWDDLLIGSGKGGNLSLFLNDGRGGFKRAVGGILGRTVARDQTTILGLAPGQLLAGSANYEDGLKEGGAVKWYDARRTEIADAVPGADWSGGPLALADVNGDGDLDLFVGGRVIGGRYPEAAGSVLMRSDAGRFVMAQTFENLGLVSGAVFSDLDGDGKPDLILACEWGPIRIFRNQSGTLIPWDSPVIETADLPVNHGPRTSDHGLRTTLSQLTGLWAGVTTGDLDGDGRLDIVASNWGLNSKYRANRQFPLKVYYGDVDGNGTVEVIEAHFDEALKKEVPERGLRSMWNAIPALQQQWTSFEAYGNAGVQDLFGEKLKTMRALEVNTLASMAFLNRGDHFVAAPLPMEAQLAPGFGVCVCDFDGDGNEDVFLSQNFYAVNPENTRSDAGRGLWLRGDGTGRLIPVFDERSGLAVYGEQRGCAAADFDGDGRVDLVVSQNGAQTKLYRNVGAKPGLRVRLIGTSGNPLAVGATMRLVYGTTPGPAREIHAGSGYWSQDSAVQVLGKRAEPNQIWVRWPGGKTTMSAIPAGAKEVEVDETGKSTVRR